MDQAFQTTHFCLPVTALHTLQLKQGLLILVGHGSFLSVIDAAKQNLLSRQRVFTVSHIHGITGDSSPADNNEPRPLLIWGGCFICFASLRISDLDIRAPNTEPIFEEVTIGPIIRAPDWILDASFNYGPSSSEAPACLVTAHNELVVLHFGQSQYSLRFRTDALLRSPDLHRISPGEDPLLYSARIRCTRSNGSFLITAGTASGHILHWSSQSLPHTVLKLSELHTGHKGAIFGVDQFNDCFASCSDDREVRLGWLDILIATLDVSEVSKERLSDMNNTARAQLDNGSSRVVEICRHGSRVWGVRFLCRATDFLGFASIGEDGVCKILQIGREEVVQLTSDHYHVGKNIWSAADGQLGGHHCVITGGADGAIVSREILRRPHGRGADAQEIATSLSKHAGSHLENFEMELTPLFAKLEIRAVARSGSSAKPPSIKQYQFISNSCLLALTDSGYLLSCTEDESTPVNSDPSNQDENIMPADALPISSKWSFRHRFKAAFRQRVVMSNSKDHLVFLGNGNGNLFVCFPEGAEDVPREGVAQLDMPISWLNIAGVKYVSDSSREYYIVAYSNDRNKAKAVFVFIHMGTEEMGPADSPERSGQRPIDRFRNSSNASFETKVYEIDLPEDFEPSSAAQLYHTQALVLGSKQSGIAIYIPLGERMDGHGLPFYNRPTHIPRVHGGDHVTSVSGISSSGNHPDSRKDYFLTTGRNGVYAVHSLSLEDNQVVFEILDNSTTPFRSGIEGSYCAQAQEPLYSSSEQYHTVPCWTRQWQLEGSKHVRSGDLILYGFDAKKFLVWNESQRLLIFSIDCGNAHRPWAYNTYASPIGTAGLGFPHHGPFAWTQAKSMNIVSISRPDHSVVQNGGHGREIKALSVSPLPYQDLRHGILSGRLIATGAEDTCIRFFVVGKSTETHARNKMICVRTLKQHTTGVQHLSFSSRGEFLFSSGGCEELYAWQIRHGVPGVNLGVRLMYIFPKEAENSDLRITDFRVQDDGPGVFLVSAVYSNSMIKFFRYTVASSSCEVLRRFFYLDQCIVQVNDDAENATLTASRQGKCLTRITGSTETGTLTASTDGHLAFWSSPSRAQPFRHSVHQNSIKAMHVVNLLSKDRHDRLVITGGDDNALGLTLMRIMSTQNMSQPPVFQSLLIPQAHAAAITAICVQPTNHPMQPPKEASISFLSTGNDQRVKLWSVSIQLDRMGTTPGDELGGHSMAALQIRLVADQPTEVADVGDMELVSELDLESEFEDDEETGRRYVPKPLPSNGGKIVRVLVVGVGMEILQFKM